VAGSAPGPRNAAGEPEDARPIAPEATDARGNARAVASRLPVARVRLYHPSDGNHFFRIKVLPIALATAGVLATLPFPHLRGLRILILDLTGYVIIPMVIVIRANISVMRRLEISATRLRVLSGRGRHPTVVHEYRRAAVRELELQDGHLTIKDNRYFLIHTLGRRHARRLRKALMRYNWIGQDGTGPRVKNDRATSIVNGH
jgi:hypothetical protein